MDIETYMRAYFILNGVKVSKPKKDKPIPQVDFYQLPELTLERLNQLKRFNYTRCTLFDNWPKDENNNLIM